MYYGTALGQEHALLQNPHHLPQLLAPAHPYQSFGSAPLLKVHQPLFCVLHSAFRRSNDPSPRPFSPTGRRATPTAVRCSHAHVGRTPCPMQMIRALADPSVCDVGSHARLLIVGSHAGLPLRSDSVPAFSALSLLNIHYSLFSGLRSTVPHSLSSARNRSGSMA